jgi:two-component system response regulator CpxR
MLPKTPLENQTDVFKRQRKPKRILLIEDDVNLAEMLAEYLTLEGYVVLRALTGRSGLERLGAREFALIILDVMLPDSDGFSVLRNIRERSSVPIILLASRPAVSDLVRGLDDGADDYVPKPFTPVELLARMRAILRRGDPARTNRSPLDIDDLHLDHGSRMVERCGEPIACTGAEFDVLRMLIAQAGTILTRETLSRAALGRLPYPGDRAIDNIVSALRKKLGTRAGRKDRFRSIRNVGYIYLLPDEATEMNQEL